MTHSLAPPPTARPQKSLLQSCLILLWKASSCLRGIIYHLLIIFSSSVLLSPWEMIFFFCSSHLFTIHSFIMHVAHLVQGRREPQPVPADIGFEGGFQPWTSRTYRQTTTQIHTNLESPNKPCACFLVCGRKKKNADTYCLTGPRSA